MANDRSILERQMERVELRPFTLEGFHRQRERKQRNHRIAAGVVGLVVAVAGLGGVVQISSERTPAGDVRSPFLGVWVSTADTDGGTQTMTIRVSDDGAVEIVVRDDVATVCSGSPSTMTGTGRIEAGTQLVIPAPAYTCDDGSEPEALSGPPLQEQFRDWTLFLDPQTDTLTDGVGGLWLREGAKDPSTPEDPLADPEPLWPQTSLEEVRQAQELADAGDPRYTWQVDRDLGPQLGQHHPDDAEIFARFLEEELGWEEFRWGEAFAHPDGLDPGDVVYIRCAPGQTNPLYPADPERPGCAPTIDELRYETVKINVAQLDRQVPSGIWVVTGWEMLEPAEQIAPPSDAEIAAQLGAFLQARIEGEGAEEFDVAVDDPFISDPSSTDQVDHEIPLLYATSTGASYERSEFELVDGPVWPGGWEQFEVRLFAQNGQTVVKQVFSLERDETGRLRLGFDPMGLGGAVPTTTENGKAVPVQYGFLDGEVTYRAAYPAGPGMEDTWDRGPDWVTVVGDCGRNEAGCSDSRRIMTILADPRPIDPGCQVAPAPTDAEALARSIRSDPDLEATAPVGVTIGGVPALQIDVVLAPDATACPWQLPGLSSTTPLLLNHAPLVVYGGDWARLYLLDLPGGSGRVLAIAIISSEEDSERALKVAAPIVDSIEFPAR